MTLKVLQVEYEQGNGSFNRQIKTTDCPLDVGVAEEDVTSPDPRGPFRLLTLTCPENSFTLNYRDGDANIIVRTE
jgi:hypothetical protein